MVVTQSYSDVLHLATMLPLNEQEMLIRAIESSISKANYEQNIRCKLISLVEGGVDEIRDGNSYSNDEVFEYANRLIDQSTQAAI
jgi:hypothetical protein